MSVPLCEGNKTASSKRLHMPIETNFELKEELGRGSFSVVRVGVEAKTGKHFAVKVIAKSNASDYGDKDKDNSLLENEIYCWSLLDHPNVVVMKEVYDTGESYCIVQELVTGGELFDKIVERQHYSEKDASVALLQIVEAIDHMHNRGVAHRDLKPENLLLSDKSENAVIKVADFGLSAPLNDKVRLKQAVGTPGYIAPEVLFTLEDENLVYGKEVDIWSIGVILYILLAGYPPFYAEDDEEVFEKTVVGKFDFPAHSWSSISQEAKDLITHILVVDPQRRWSAQQILNHPWMKGMSPEAHLPGTLAEIKKFNARQKWKAAIGATRALKRFARGFGAVQQQQGGKYTQLFNKQQQH